MESVPAKSQPVDREIPIEHADPDWFRKPTPREHRIAAALFIFFGVFFVLMFFVLSGWWFRWVIVALGVYSTIHGARHARDSRHAPRAE
ncbi:MAG: hypothetical protein H7Z14_14365 [Anaerolineae bacterium]|nr:hypothetical protein [Phycisphaerae bacterium]